MIKNRLLYFVIVIFSLSVVFFYGGKVPYLILYTVLAISVWSVLSAIISAKACVMTSSLDKQSITKGETVALVLDIQNKSPLFFPYINISFKKLEEFDFNNSAKSVSSVPFSRQRYQIDMVGKYRGVYDLNILEIRVMDFLGLFNIPITLKKTQPVTVFPRILDIGAFSIVDRKKMNSDRTQNYQMNEDLTAVSDVRNYLAGDNMRKIHWKLTARMQELMSKNYEHVTKSSMTMLLDLSQSVGDDQLRLRLEDKMIEVAVSMIYFLLKEIWSVNLIYEEKTTISHQINDISLFETAFLTLSAVQFQPEHDILRLINGLEVNLWKQSQICILTVFVSDEILMKIREIAETGINISVILISDIEMEGETALYIEALLNHGIPFYVVDTQSDLGEVFG